jgi:hypothetical protein
MTPRLERSVDFWLPVFLAPECQAAHCGMQVNAEAIEQTLASSMVYPLAGENGGYLFIQKDPWGTVWELHSLFRKPGWGREAATIGKAALDIMVGRGMQLLYTTEIAGLATPPRSYGWRLASEEFFETPIGASRIWILTKAMWEASPARKHARN